MGWDRRSTTTTRRGRTSQWWQRRTTSLVRFALDVISPPCHTSNVRSKTMRFWMLLGVVLLNPLWFCIMFFVLPLGSIGPVVIWTWPLNTIIVAALLFVAANRLSSNRVRIASKIAAIPVGILIGILQLNSYFPLTAWFGINDFLWG